MRCYLCQYEYAGLITLKETSDVDYLFSVFTHPDVWDWVSDDDCVKDDYQPTIHQLITYLAPELDGVPIGCLMLVRCNAVTVELHTAILPEYRGKCIGEVFKALMAWLDDSQFSRIRTWVPDWNKAAYIAAKRVGFELVGTETKAFLKDEKLHDLHLFGVTKCQQ